MTFHPLGDSAILLNFEQRIDPEINGKVVSIIENLKSNPIKGVTGWIPAYCSLTVSYDSKTISYEQLEKKLEEISLVVSDINSKPRKFEIPVCYDEEFGLDLESVSEETGLSTKEIINLHTSRQFRVYMLGFIPGFVYMGSLPSELTCSRKTAPRLKVPGLSVGLAGQQTGIYPTEAPGGWQIIGRTPVNILDIRKEDPFLFATGDDISFYAISIDEHTKMVAEVKTGDFNWESLNA